MRDACDGDLHPALRTSHRIDDSPTVARVDLAALKSNFRSIVEYLAREQPAHAAAA